MTVVAGVDESPTSKQVAAAAIEQARFRDTDLHLVHVTYAPMVYTEVPIDWSEAFEAQRVHVWTQLEPLVSEANIQIEQVDLDGYPADVLVDFTNDIDAELLVVGTRGRGEFASFIMGSTSHRAIHLAKCDVLVVRRTEES